MDPNLSEGRFNPKTLVTVVDYSCNQFHKAVSKLDVDLIKRILESGRVDIHETNCFGQTTSPGVKPGHLHQHFCFGKRTSALAQLFESKNIEDMDVETLWKTIELLEVRN